MKRSEADAEKFLTHNKDELYFILNSLDLVSIFQTLANCYREALLSNDTFYVKWATRENVTYKGTFLLCDELSRKLQNAIPFDHEFRPFQEGIIDATDSKVIFCLVLSHIAKRLEAITLGDWVKNFLD